jgi:hypothetical protein
MKREDMNAPAPVYPQCEVNDALAQTRRNVSTPHAQIVLASEVEWFRRYREMKNHQVSELQAANESLRAALYARDAENVSLNHRILVLQSDLRIAEQRAACGHRTGDL